MTSCRRNWIFNILAVRIFAIGGKISSLFAFIIFLNACNIPAKIKTGDEASSSGQFWKATQLYQKEYDKSRSALGKHAAAFGLAESYERMNQPLQAEKWYEDALKYKPGDVLTMYRYGLALKNIGNYTLSYKILDSLAIQVHDPNRFNVLMTSLKNAMDWTADSSINPFKLSEVDFNSPASDYWVAIDSNKQVYFTSDRANDEKDQYLWTGRAFSKIYKVSEGSDSYPLNTEINQKMVNSGLLTFSPDKLHLAYCKCTGQENADANCKIYIQDKLKGKWTDPYKPAFINDSINYLSLVFDATGQTIYFTMQDPSKLSGFDVYSSKREGTVFGKPIRLPGSINTEFNEKYVTIDADTLYVASDNLGGMGGLDIYKSYKEGKNWTPMINLKSPVNSPFDDFGFQIISHSPTDSLVTQIGYLSSNRPGGHGNDDIYFFEKVRPPIAMSTPQDTFKHIKKYNLALTLYVYGYGVANNRESTNTGDRKPIANARITVPIDLSNDTIWQTNSIGIVKKNIAFDKDFTLKITAEGYLNSSTRIKTSDLKIDSSKTLQELSVIVYLHPKLYEVEFDIKDIYYDYDKYNIREDAKPPLNNLVQLLKDNPSVSVRIASHTDCRGTKVYNEKLSGLRAASVVDYLIAQGIDSHRLSSIGYGESRPVTNCKCSDCTEAQHQSNRRTTFELLK
jgi:outer membrane protein OmpA-like peptidoglycan-associated protein